MKVTKFGRTTGLLVVRARIWSPQNHTVLSLAIDTGAANATVTPDVIDKLGYSPRHGERITTVRAAIGKEHGYTLRARQLSALGFTLPDYLIHVFDLATGDDIDGLIGLSFLDQFNDEVRSKEGRILVERALDAA